MRLFDRADGWGAAANLGAALALVAAANAAIFATGAGAADPAYLALSFAPPGWLVATVWMVIFAFWALARWRAVQHGEAGRDAGWWVVALIVSALLYPLSSCNFELRAGAVQNAATLAFVLFVAWRLARVSRGAAWLMLPSVLWVMFANLLGWAALAQAA
jgi:tryptophan-rich sensory protein